MKRFEYLLSLLVALLLLSTIAAWTHADYIGNQARFGGRPGTTTPAVMI